MLGVGSLSFDFRELKIKRPLEVLKEDAGLARLPKKQRVEEWKIIAVGGNG